MKFFGTFVSLIFTLWCVSANAGMHCEGEAALQPLTLVNATQPSPNDSIASWARQDQRVWQALLDGADIVYKDYRNGQWSNEANQDLLNCFASMGRGDEYVYAMQKVFLERSIQELKASKNNALQLFAIKIEENAQTVFAFRDLPSLNKVGGFHRGRRSIFIDFTQIPPNEWMLIFIHESAHSLDDTLKQAVSVYADTQNVLVPSFAPYLQYSDAAFLPISVKKNLDTWLMAGLNRGLLAEARAWSVTLNLYREGVKANLWQPISWLEEMGSDQRAGESTYMAVLHKLSPAFPDPNKDIFSTPLIQSELKRIRQQLLAE